MNTRLSIIVHNINRAQELDRCLASLVKILHRPLEIVIIDAGSTDDSVSVIERYAERMTSSGIDCIFQTCELMGVAASRNHAFHYATGDFVMFLDNDAEIHDPENIENAIDRLRNDPGHAIISFKLYSHDTDRHDNTSWVYRRPVDKWFDREFKTFTFTGGAFMIRSQVFRELGGFWSRLDYSREEEELAYAIIDKGFSLLYSPSLAVRHYPGSRTVEQLKKRRCQEIRNGVLVLWRRIPHPFMIPLVAARICSQSIRYTLQFKSLPFPIVKGAAEAFFNRPRQSGERRPISYSAFFTYVRLHGAAEHE